MTTKWEKIMVKVDADGFTINYGTQQPQTSLRATNEQIHDDITVDINSDKQEKPRQANQDKSGEDQLWKLNNIQQCYPKHEREHKTKLRQTLPQQNHHNLAKTTATSMNFWTSNARCQKQAKWWKGETPNHPQTNNKRNITEKRTNEHKTKYGRPTDVQHTTTLVKTTDHKDKAKQRRERQ